LAGPARESAYGFAAFVGQLAETSHRNPLAQAASIPMHFY
jgi:hypothetical protein